MMGYDDAGFDGMVVGIEIVEPPTIPVLFSTSPRLLFVLWVRRGVAIPPLRGLTLISLPPPPAWTTSASASASAPKLVLVLVLVMALVLVLVLVLVPAAAAAAAAAEPSDGW